MKYLISISYDGSKFNGFQRLNNEKTVQKELEKVLSFIDKNEVKVKGAGRTDKGVHALDQKVHFELNNIIPPERLKKAINDMICKYIYVNNCEFVDNEFHARFNVKKKRYIYKISFDTYNPINCDYILYENRLNVFKMKMASMYLLGKHDYKKFVSGQREDYSSEIYKIKFILRKNELQIIFEGKSFYRYMVRNMVGYLINVGKGKVLEKDYKTIFNNKVDIPTAISNGLYLDRIWY